MIRRCIIRSRMIALNRVLSSSSSLFISLFQQGQYFILLTNHVHDMFPLNSNKSNIASACSSLILARCAKTARVVMVLHACNARSIVLYRLWAMLTLVHRAQYNEACCIVVNKTNAYFVKQTNKHFYVQETDIWPIMGIY